MTAESGALQRVRRSQSAATDRDLARHRIANKIELMRRFVFRWAITTVAVMVASSVIRGIRYDSAAALIGADAAMWDYNPILSSSFVLSSKSKLAIPIKKRKEMLETFFK